MKNKRLFIIITTIVVLLLIPFVVMQFTDEVSWTILDFVTMGILLTVTGLFCEVVMRKIKTFKGRFIFIGIILIVFFLIWAELAVGLFGTMFAGS